MTNYIDWRDMPADLRAALIAAHICLNCRQHSTDHCEHCGACSETHTCYRKGIQR